MVEVRVAEMGHDGIKKGNKNAEGRVVGVKEQALKSKVKLNRRVKDVILEFLRKNGNKR